MCRIRCVQKAPAAEDDVVADFQEVGLTEAEATARPIDVLAHLDPEQAVDGADALVVPPQQGLHAAEMGIGDESTQNPSSENFPIRPVRILVVRRRCEGADEPPLD
eukprot:CAMPEP_0206495722 /NCGR_PEP_ID=MMETSP0324_2-20121206/48807_1 /ASSEMBLY_ACC=CAM_ASM_000836 /TAXON_ID=2866 /ORGANISM="Crypthecodinium cohnii, Strain Seligo" /LENGTH=105 /DNA_ID=CAMNT_0053980251 /DNA_START=1064 /DNA_END=1378 /DNA_ORIENTATION=-